MNYENPTPVAACLVPVRIDGTLKLFGIIRNNHPGFGGKALPGGYVDKGENFEVAAAREFKEEVGIVTHASEWTLLVSHISPENRVLVFCVLNRILEAHEVENLPVVSNEIQGYTFIDADTALVFSLHNRAVEQYFASQLQLVA